MKTKLPSCIHNSQNSQELTQGLHGAAEQPFIVPTTNKLARRSFMKRLAAGGASLLPASVVLAEDSDHRGRLGTITRGDAAILRFLAAAEILETDFWQQYTEFANLDGPYADALETIDDDMPTYVEQNTADEFSHQDFLNAFLVKMRRQ